MALFASPFRPEPAFRHSNPPQNLARTAILWCNLGTPEAPTAAAVRPYLAEFLSDRRVIEIPMIVWKLILHGIILRTRPAKSAAKYASIWTPEGSPLRLWTQKQAKLLEGWLGERGHRVSVRYAMRYGQPNVAAQLDALKAEGIEQVLILPAYPQYSGTSTASVFDAVYAWGQTVRRLPELRFVNQFHDDSRYIEALAQSVQKHWATQGKLDADPAKARLVLSFHGVPERTLHLGDPYHCQCQKTARLLREKLGLSREQVRVCFQSRLGRAKWLEPYTEPTLKALAQAGVQRIDMLCPAFTSDCLETLEEIVQEGQHAYKAAGGQAFHYIPCLNDSPAWIDALGHVALRHLSGWDTQSVDVAEPQARGARAKAAGAQNC